MGVAGRHRSIGSTGRWPATTACALRRPTSHSHAWRGSTDSHHEVPRTDHLIGSRQPWSAALHMWRGSTGAFRPMHFPAHKEKPRCVSSGVLGVNPGDDLLSHGLSHTTIGAAAFHFRVRDGIGWFHSANFTREAFGESHSSLWDKAPASHSSCDVACTWMLLRRCRKAKAT